MNCRANHLRRIVQVKLSLEPVCCLQGTKGGRQPNSEEPILAIRGKQTPTPRLAPLCRDYALPRSLRVPVIGRGQRRVAVCCERKMLR